MIKYKPQMKGIITKLYTMTPKKPNSALRKVAKVLTSKGLLTAYIPGINHTLNIHNVVLLIPKKTQDLPGVKYRIIPGARDYKLRI
jgi:small subunit ribosomal protein S12